jgi:hypothetical protein
MQAAFYVSAFVYIEKFTNYIAGCGARCHVEFLPWSAKCFQFDRFIYNLGLCVRHPSNILLSHMLKYLHVCSVLSMFKFDCDPVCSQKLNSETVWVTLMISAFESARCCGVTSAKDRIEWNSTSVFLYAFMECTGTAFTFRTIKQKVKYNFMWPPYCSFTF